MSESRESREERRIRVIEERRIREFMAPSNCTCASYELPELGKPNPNCICYESRHREKEVERLRAKDRYWRQCMELLQESVKKIIEEKANANAIKVDLT